METQLVGLSFRSFLRSSIVSPPYLTVVSNESVDPDLSNPTRHRFERPLDTIRAFEAAIDGSYSNRRTSYARPGTANPDRFYNMMDALTLSIDESPNGYSRRSSYFGGKLSHFLALVNCNNA